LISKIALRKLQNAAIRWHSRHARDLPWRRTRDPYAIMVSEFMLQQTTVAAVIPYYRAWMILFPTVNDLAHASEQRVLRAWEGLGYYSRARNLRATAQKIMRDFGGTFPRTVAELRSLPGVGRYTAAAILSFAFDDPVGIVEANTARLLARLFNVTASIDTAGGREQLWKHAERIVPERNSGQFNSALMDLGSLVCLPQKPRCTACPVQSFCRAEDPSGLPRKKPRPAVKNLTELHSFTCQRGKVLLQSCEHRWRGMWMLPALASRPSRRAAYSSIFSFTHHRIRLEAFSNSPVRRSPQLTWFKLDGLDLLPMPNPHRRALHALLQDSSPRTRLAGAHPG
jgi:A/G-specific adenine glycosylase